MYPNYITNVYLYSVLDIYALHIIPELFERERFFNTCYSTEDMFVEHDYAIYSMSTFQYNRDVSNYKDNVGSRLDELMESPTHISSHRARSRMVTDGHKK